MNATPQSFRNSVPVSKPSRVETWDQGAGMSSGKFSKSDLLSYRNVFKARWQRFVRQHFQSPEHAAYVFGVDASTARNWWEGSNAPSGFAVGMAYEMFPDEAANDLRGEP